MVSENPLVTLFSGDGFPARWDCGLGWTRLLGWTHIVADLAICAAYLAIPISILIFASRRRDLRFPIVAFLFASFICACGITHAIEAVIFWHPWYRLSAVAKVVTAMVSWGTVVAIVKLAPGLMEMPRIVAERGQFLGRAEGLSEQVGQLTRERDD